MGTDGAYRVIRAKPPKYWAFCRSADVLRLLSIAEIVPPQKHSEKQDTLTANSANKGSNTGKKQRLG
jgi:hypothetical protein